MPLANHNRAFRETKTMTLVKKKQKTRFFPFPRGTAVTLAKAQPCLSRKQNCDSRERKKTRIFSLFEWHGRDFRVSTTVPLAKAKPWLSRTKKKQKTRFVFPFLRGTAVTLAKAQPCLPGKQNCDSHERKKNRKHVFSRFREARP